MKKGHTPIRMCMICRQRFEKNSIMRYVRPKGSTKLERDDSQTQAGRGYYLCLSEECQEKFIRAAKHKVKGVKL